jgi:hypothetical protein
MATTIHPGFAFWSSWGEEWQVLVLVSAPIRNLNECLLRPCFVLARIWFSRLGPKKKAQGESAPYGFGVSPVFWGLSFSLVEQLWD